MFANTFVTHFPQMSLPPGQSAETYLQAFSRNRSQFPCMMPSTSVAE